MPIRTGRSHVSLCADIRDARIDILSFVSTSHVRATSIIDAVTNVYLEIDQAEPGSIHILNQITNLTYVVQSHENRAISTLPTALPFIKDLFQ